MKTKYTIILLLLISSFSGFGQSANKEEAVSKKMAAPNMMSKNLKAYQLKSENKITDFYSYLNILGNKTVQDEMKLHTINEIKKLFKDENISIPDLINCNGNHNCNNKIKLEDFLNHLIKSNENIVFSVENLQESYVQNNDGTYSWTIGYTLNITKEKSIISFKNIMQNAIVLQENKAFGKRTKSVLSTYLTEIWLK
jgi:hypothetical protein